MSKGNPIVACRVNAEMLAEMQAALTRRNDCTADMPWDMAAWVKAAIREKLAHLKRGKRPLHTAAQPEEISDGQDDFRAVETGLVQPEVSG